MQLPQKPQEKKLRKKHIQNKKFVSLHQNFKKNTKIHLRRDKGRDVQ